MTSKPQGDASTIRDRSPSSPCPPLIITLGVWILTLHLEYVAGYTGPLLFAGYTGPLLLFHLVDDMLSVCHTDSFLDRAQELVKKTINKHAKYTTTELDRSRPVQKGAVTRRRLGKQVAVNMYTMGTSYVGKVRDVRLIVEAQIGGGVADMVKFEA